VWYVCVCFFVVSVFVCESVCVWCLLVCVCVFVCLSVCGVCVCDCLCVLICVFV